MTWRGPNLRPGTAALMAVCAFFAAWLAIDLASGKPGLPPPRAAVSDGTAAAAATADRVSDATAVALPSKDRFAQVAERPLFQPSRRPPPVIAVAVPAAPAAPAVTAAVLQGYSLMGVVIVGGQRIAVLKTPASPAAPLRISEGTVVSGWTAARIDEDRVLFRSGANEHVLEFPRLTPQTPTVPVSAPYQGNR